MKIILIIELTTQYLHDYIVWILLSLSFVIQLNFESYYFPFRIHFTEWLNIWLLYISFITYLLALSFSFLKQIFRTLSNVATDTKQIIPIHPTKSAYETHWNDLLARIYSLNYTWIASISKYMANGKAEKSRKKKKKCGIYFNLALSLWSRIHFSNIQHG